MDETCGIDNKLLTMLLPENSNKEQKMIGHNVNKMLLDVIDMINIEMCSFNKLFSLILKLKKRKITQ